MEKSNEKKEDAGLKNIYSSNSNDKILARNSQSELSCLQSALLKQGLKRQILEELFDPTQVQEEPQLSAHAPHWTEMIGLK